MSTDLPSDAISEEPIGSTPPPEPFLAELAELPPRRRPVPPPQPGFWWSILWCAAMLIVTQIVCALLGFLGVFVVRFVELGPKGALDWLGKQQTGHDYLLPVMAVVEVSLIVFSWLVLRLVVGRDWRRQVALRRPAVTHVVLAVLLWPALALTASGIYQAAKVLPGLDHFLSYLVAVCATLAVVAVCWLLVRVTTGRDWTRALARQRPATQLVLATLECLVILAVGAQIFRLVDPHLPTLDFFKGSMMEEMVKDVRDWPPLAGVLIVGLGPGLGEELWCRAFLGRGLVGRHGVVMGVVLTSFFFGAIHVDPHQGTMAALLGLALHFSYLTTRSLWVPMLLHFLNNSLSVLGEKIDELLRQLQSHKVGERIKSIDTDEALPWYVLVAAACLVAAVCWAFYTSRGRLVRTDGSDRPPWRPPFPGVAHPPAGSGTAVVCPWPSLASALAVLAAVAALAGALWV